MSADLQTDPAFSLPCDIRPLRPVALQAGVLRLGAIGDAVPDPWDTWDTWMYGPFPAARALLADALGGYRAAMSFGLWLAEAYFRAYWNAWPSRAVSYRRATRCALRPARGSGDSVGAILRLAASVLAGGPARRFPESGEARFADARRSARLAADAEFTVRAAPPETVAAYCAAARAEAAPLAAWLYSEGMPRALAAAATDNDAAVRRMVLENCSPEEFYGQERKEQT